MEQTATLVVGKKKKKKKEDERKKKETNGISPTASVSFITSSKHFVAFLFFVFSSQVLTQLYQHFLWPFGGSHIFVPVVTSCTSPSWSSIPNVLGSPPPSPIPLHPPVAVVLYSDSERGRRRRDDGTGSDEVTCLRRWVLGFLCAERPVVMYTRLETVEHSGTVCQRPEQMLHRGDRVEAEMLLYKQHVAQPDTRYLPETLFCLGTRCTVSLAVPCHKAII